MEEKQLKQSITLDELHALFLTLDAVEGELANCFRNRFFKTDPTKDSESALSALPTPISFITATLKNKFEDCEYMCRYPTTVINNQLVLNKRIYLCYAVVKFGIKFQVEIPLEVARVKLPHNPDEDQLCEVYVVNPPKPRLDYIAFDCCDKCVTY